MAASLGAKGYQSQYRSSLRIGARLLLEPASAARYRAGREDQDQTLTTQAGFCTPFAFMCVSNE